MYTHFEDPQVFFPRKALLTLKSISGRIMEANRGKKVERKREFSILGECLIR